jgi:hypothetical protein
MKCAGAATRMGYAEQAHLRMFANRTALKPGRFLVQDTASPGSILPYLCRPSGGSETKRNQSFWITRTPDGYQEIFFITNELRLSF